MHVKDERYHTENFKKQLQPNPKEIKALKEHKYAN